MDNEDIGQILNPPLYWSLRKRFGEVRISNQGQRYLARKRINPITRKEEDEVVDPGEYYVIRCPICNDHKPRCYINYRWNSKDPNSGRIVGRHLIHCFNDEGGCSFRNFGDELKNYVAGPPVLQRSVDDAVQYAEMFKEVTLPGKSVPLASLDPSHPAVQYLRDVRKFDPKDLTDNWGVHFCVDSAHPLERNRIIIPIHREGKLVGYQARSYDGSDPKYYTMRGLNKGRILFNGDQARNYKFGVVVESVFGVFRVGPQAVATLGKSMSGFQRQLAFSYWGNGGLCLMFDPDAITDMERTMKVLDPSAFRLGAFSLTLPDDKDPDEFSRNDIWAMISSYAHSRGIKLVSL